MSKPIDIVIIGAGNLATHIAQSFVSKKHIHLIQIFNHQKTKKALALAKNLQCELTSDYKKIKRDADIYIISVKDDAIEDVCKQLILLELKGLVVHTSGSTDLQILKNVSKQIGVYYPLETFYITAKINWKNTPILIEANTKQAQSTLKRLANSISNRVESINSKDRLHVHLAAVFACNFTNAMYIAAYEILEKQINKESVKLLLPIIHSSVDKLNIVHPKKAQTGPAVRDDKIVMEKHLKLLTKNKELSNLYLSISNLIIKQKNN